LSQLLKSTFHHLALPAGDEIRSCDGLSVADSCCAELERARSAAASVTKEDLTGFVQSGSHERLRKRRSERAAQRVVNRCSAYAATEAGPSITKRCRRAVAWLALPTSDTRRR